MLPGRQDAGCNHAQKWQEAIFGGRQDVGWFQFMGFLRSENPMPRSGRMVGMEAGCNQFMGFCEAKPLTQKMAGCRRQDVGCFQCLEFARSANSEGRKSA
jgi:hypothetical protein